MCIKKNDKFDIRSIANDFIAGKDSRKKRFILQLILIVVILELICSSIVTKSSIKTKENFY